MSAIPGEMPRPESQQIRSRRFGGRFTPSRPPDRRADAEAAEVKRVAGFRKAYESGALQCGVGSSGALVTTAEGGLTTADLEEAAVLLPSGGRLRCDSNNESGRPSRPPQGRATVLTRGVTCALTAC